MLPASFEVGLAWGTVPLASFAELIDAAARHGFPTLSISPHLYFDAIEGGITESSLRKRIADAGSRVRIVDGISAGLPGMPDEPIPFIGGMMPRYDTEQCLRMAEALGAEVINLGHYGAQPVAWAELVDGYGEIARRLAAAGVGAVFEFIPDTGLPDMATAQVLARECGAGSKILVDCWHLSRTGGTPADILALPDNSIGAFQLCDRIAPQPGTPYVPMTGRYLPGEGELPLGEIAAAVLANSPGLSAEMEVFSDELSGMPVNAAAARAAKSVRAWRGSLAAG